MAHGDESVGTGRSTRMLQAAIDAAEGKEHEHGKHVLVVAYDISHCNTLWDMSRRLCNHMPVERDRQMYPSSCGAGVVEFKHLGELTVDWVKLKVSAIHHDVVFFDHYTVEAALKLAIDESHRFDA